MQYSDLKYLKDALNLNARAQEWPEANALPLFLKSNTQILLAKTSGTAFVLARPLGDATLPDLKRLHAQLSKRADTPVVISTPTADARQRKALVAQAIPFICTGKQAFLPFLGIASTEWGKAKLEMKRKAKLTPKAQQTAIWGAIRARAYTLAELRTATGMSASQASSAISELSDRNMAGRSKNGRTVTVTPIVRDELLKTHMQSLASPVLKTVCVRKDSSITALPPAGESALADCSALNTPPISQKATSRTLAKSLAPLEILDGELPECETAHVQIWKYNPLFAESSEIDAISLALSLAGTGDERIEHEINSLFGEEYEWQLAL